MTTYPDYTIVRNDDGSASVAMLVEIASFRDPVDAEIFLDAKWDQFHGGQPVDGDLDEVLAEPDDLPDPDPEPEPDPVPEPGTVAEAAPEPETPAADPEQPAVVADAPDISATPKLPRTISDEEKETLIKRMEAGGKLTEVVDDMGIDFYKARAAWARHVKANPPGK